MSRNWKYSAIVIQPVFFASTASCGAAETPSPQLIVVIPCASRLAAVAGDSSMGEAVCPIMSMKPGATTSPVASITRSAGSLIRPIRTIFPSRIPTSATYHGAPVPSTMRPPLMRTSNRSAASIPGEENRPQSTTVCQKPRRDIATSQWAIDEFAVHQPSPNL